MGGRSDDGGAQRASEESARLARIQAGLAENEEWRNQQLFNQAQQEKAELKKKEEEAKAKEREKQEKFQQQQVDTARGKRSLLDYM